jgi:hypothetical protein
MDEMSRSELDEIAAEFDREFVADTFGPPPPEILARLRRMKKRGRPRVGAGSQAISVTVEKTLLRRIDQVARRRRTTRAQLIGRGLRAVLAAEEAAAR